MAVALGLVLTWFDRREARAFASVGDHEAVVTGAVHHAERPGRVLVEYVHPATGQRVEVQRRVWQGRPPDGTVADVVVDLDDPRSVRLASDRFPYLTNVLAYLLVFVLPALLWTSARRTHVWLVARRMTSAAPAFAMTGVLRPGRRRRSRPRLDLFPLDVPAGAEAICTVPVLTTSGAPFGQPFLLEVKGVPRRLARVVARTDRGVLWPAGPARMSGKARRPDGPAQAVPPMPVTAAMPAAVGWRPSAARTFSGWGASFVGASVLLVAVLARTPTGSAQADQLVREGDRAVGEVVGHDEVAEDVVLVDIASGAEVRAGAGNDVDEFPIGMRFPLVMDPGDPVRAVILAHPYDRATPIVWSGIAVSIAGAGLVGRLSWWRRLRAITTDAAAPALCVSVLPDGVRGGSVDLVVFDDADRPLGIVEVHAAGSNLEPDDWRPSRGAVAGPLDPGAVVLVRRVDGRPFEPVGRLRAPELTSASLLAEARSVQLPPPSGSRLAPASVPLRTVGLWERLAPRLRRSLPRIEVSGGELRLHLPTDFADRPIRTAASSTVAVDGTKVPRGGSERLAHPLVIPFFRTGPQWRVASLFLLFEEPVRVPRLRRARIFDRFESRSAGLSYRRTRSSAGEWIDGVALDVASPVGAVATLRAAGVREVTDLEGWFRERGARVVDAVEREALLRRERRDRRLAGSLVPLLLVPIGVLYVASGSGWAEALFFACMVAYVAILLALRRGGTT